MDKTKRINIYNTFGGMRMFAGDSEDMRELYKCWKCEKWVDTAKMEVHNLGEKQVVVCIKCDVV